MIECIVGSIIFLSKHCPLLGHKDYYIINPFIKRFSNIGIIDIGVHGFFSLIGNTGQQKHGWILVCHQRTEHGPKFFICSNLQRVWRETIGVDGEPTAPKDAIFYKGKIYWLHVKITFEEGSSYVYRLYLLNIEMNIWGMHSIYTGHRKRCVSDLTLQPIDMYCE